MNNSIVIDKFFGVISSGVIREGRYLCGRIRIFEVEKIHISISTVWQMQDDGGPIATNNKGCVAAYLMGEQIQVFVAQWENSSRDGSFPSKHSCCKCFARHTCRLNLDFMPG